MLTRCKNGSQVIKSSRRRANTYAWIYCWWTWRRARAVLLPSRQPTTGLSVLRSNILCRSCHHYRTWAQLPSSYWSGTTDDSEQRWHWGVHSPTLCITSRHRPLNSVKSTVSTAVSAVSCVMLYQLQGLYINDYMNWSTRYWLVEIICIAWEATSTGVDCRHTLWPSCNVSTSCCQIAYVRPPTRRLYGVAITVLFCILYTTLTSFS